MANPDAPFGMRIATRTGSSYVGGVNRYSIPATNAAILAVGDPVSSTGSADADGVPGVVRAAAGAAIRGVVVGFEYDRDYEDLPDYRPISVAAYALVCDDPFARIHIQEDSDTSTLAATDVGANVNFIVANANSTTGQSQVELDSNTVNTTATLPLKILQLAQIEGNTIGDNAIWECSFNTHDLKALTGSTGI